MWQTTPRGKSPRLEERGSNYVWLSSTLSMAPTTTYHEEERLSGTLSSWEEEGEPLERPHLVRHGQSLDGSNTPNPSRSPRKSSTR